MNGATLPEINALLADAIAEGVIITDARREGNPIIYVNEAFQQLTGYQADEIYGQSCRILQGKDTDPSTRARIRNAIANYQPVTAEILNYRKDGTPFWNELRIYPIRDNDQNVSHFVGIQNDVTYRRRVREFEIEQKAAVEASQLKGQFLSLVGHELRTPLNAIIGYSELVKKQLQGDSTPSAANIDKVLTAARHLKELLGDIIRLAQSKPGTTAPHKQSVSIVNLLDDLQAQIKSKHGEGASRLRVLAESDTLQITTDRTRLLQILQELVNNALRHTDYSEVHLSVRLTPAFKPTTIAFEVRDFGHGVDEAYLPYLFQPFNQNSNPDNRAKAGAGIGLAYARRSARLLGGDIVLHNNAEGGATFSVRLPLEQPQQPSPATTNQSTPRLLIVDDDADMVRLIESAFANTDFQCMTAGNGFKAIDLARESRPDVVIADGIMPGMDGIELIQKLRSIPACENTAIIVLTALDEKEKFLGAGADFFASKPFSKRRLVKMVRASLSKASSRVENDEGASHDKR